MNSAVKIQTTKNKTWNDATGVSVPLKYVTPADREKESIAARLHKKAIAAEKALQELYDMMNDATAAVEAMVKKEFELKEKKVRGKGKGGITWYNFDKSIKIGRDLNDIVKWDEPMMAEARMLLTDFLDKTLGDEKKLISELVTSAFSNSKGAIDISKIFQLLRFEAKMKNAQYSKACDLMRQAQGIDKTKLYHRIWEKMQDGSYRNIVLNISSI